MIVLFLVAALWSGMHAAPTGGPSFRSDGPDRPALGDGAWKTT